MVSAFGGMVVVLLMLAWRVGWFLVLWGVGSLFGVAILVGCGWLVWFVGFGVLSGFRFWDRRLWGCVGWLGFSLLACFVFWMGLGLMCISWRLGLLGFLVWCGWRNTGFSRLYCVFVSSRLLFVVSCIYGLDFGCLGGRMF